MFFPTVGLFKYVTIVINCVSEARYGGIGVNGEFNRCAEYEQVIVGPTTQSFASLANGGPNYVDIELCRNHLDGDPVQAAGDLRIEFDFAHRP
jgi:hypothetical protein